MQNDTFDMPSTLPQFSDKKCYYYAKAIEYLMKSIPFLSALTIWYMYDYFIAIATFLIALLVSWILRAKIRNISIPLNQQEYEYSDREIAIWYVAKYICWDKLKHHGTD